MGIALKMADLAEVYASLSYVQRRAKRSLSGEFLLDGCQCSDNQVRTHTAKLQYVSMSVTGRGYPFGKGVGMFIGIGPSIALPLIGEDQVSVRGMIQNYRGSENWPRFNPDWGGEAEIGMHVKVSGVGIEPTATFAAGLSKLNGIFDGGKSRIFGIRVYVHHW